MWTMPSQSVSVWMGCFFRRFDRCHRQKKKQRQPLLADVKPRRGTERGQFMGSRRQAWLYCAIDAPEDENDMLKKQREQLYDYAE